MATDFHLEELGPRAFEQLAVALAAATLGAHLEVYGSGRDGGREGTFRGRITWEADPKSAWDGYTVVQAKQREHTASPADNLPWLQGQIRDELNAWMGSKTKRTPFPNYLLIVSNVRLSAAQGGGVDQIRTYAEKELDRNHGAGKTDTPRRRGLRAIKVWHRDTFNALISGNQSIRAAFPALLTVGDLIDRLSALPGLVEPAALAPVLKEHAASTLRNERWVRFGEAGGLQARQSIDRIVVDLPARRGEDDRTRVLQTCLDHGDAVLRRSVWNTGRRHLVITGAAGNGKSTISTYLTQVYRAQFLSEDNVSAPTQSLIADTHASLQRLGRLAPTSRRWPLNVSLPEMANAMGPSGGPSMLRWLAEQVTTRASIEMTPVTLQKWLQTWPCVVFLDGFDEVTAPSLRQRVLDEVTEFVDLADQLDADLLLVLTTRPTGYTERILPSEFGQLDLDFLDAEEAISYGRHVTTHRLHDDVILREQVLERFSRAAAAPATERLIKTPLQVLILTFILENLGDLPATRYELFWSYYDTVYRREQEKPTSHRGFLRTRRDDITELHERVGLLLQVQAESTDDVEARLPLTTLRELARSRMIEVGHEDLDDAGALADQITEIATTRLVLLAADEHDSVSFDVRSLQELMAGRALVGGDDTTIAANLAATAPSPHWRNTWLFAAGKLFTEGDHRRSMLLELVERFDATDRHWPGWLSPVGPVLAAHLLEDGLADTKPAALRALARVALRCLSGPLPDDYYSVAYGLNVAAQHPALHTFIRNELRAAFAGTPTAVGVATLLRNAMPAFAVVPGQPSKATTAALAAQWDTSPPPNPRVRIGKLLIAPLTQLRDQPGAAMVEEALLECKKLTVRTMPDGSMWPGEILPGFICPRLEAVLADQDAASVLELCLGDLEPRQWAARSLLARAVSRVLARRPAGDRLTMPYLHP